MTWEKGCEEMVIISSQPLLGYDENVSNFGKADAAALRCRTPVKLKNL